MTNQLIIIGGGYSIKDGIELGLWNKIKNKFTFGLNYSFHLFNSTVQLYVDNDFYEKERKKLKKCSLIVGKRHTHLKPEKNTIMLYAKHEYNFDIHYGVYRSALCGMFALSVGVWLLNEIPRAEIFLLGMDYGTINENKDKYGRALTHFYQGDIEHRGISKINYYNSKSRKKGDVDYKVFNNKDIKVKIWNVSPNSNIPSFKKINYEAFFRMLHSEKLNQKQLIKQIKPKLQEVEKWQTQNWKELQKNLTKLKKNNKH